MCKELPVSAIVKKKKKKCLNVSHHGNNACSLEVTLKT